PCETTAAPFCFLSGPMQGECGKCAVDADCTGHSGNVCDTTSGLCITACHTGADCSPSDWCNAPAGSVGMCTPKLDNGKPLPMMATEVGKCDETVGMRVCKSGVCDKKDDACGYADGDGPCTAANGDAVCRSTVCATAGPNQGVCVACTMDSQC